MSQRDLDMALCGFFMGEGCIDIYASARGTTLIPRVRIALRADDEPVLRRFAARFGGFVVSVKPREPHAKGYSPRRAPSSLWTLPGWTGVARFLSVVERTPLPSQKHRQIALLREAFVVRDRAGLGKGGKSWPPKIKTELLRLKEAIAAAKIFEGTGG